MSDDQGKSQDMNQEPNVLMPVPSMPADYMQQQVYLLEDTVMAMSMAVTIISQSMKRWDRIFYPLIAGIVVFASFGFYLIYHLTQDINNITTNMEQLTRAVDKNMDIIAFELRGIQSEVKTMSSEVLLMERSLTVIEGNLGNIERSMVTMNGSMNGIATSTSRMGTDLWDLNRNISGPMSTINNVAPWRMMGGRSEPPPPQQQVIQQQAPYYGTQPYYQPNTAAPK